jgi:hypothetical protein
LKRGGARAHKGRFFTIYEELEKDKLLKGLRELGSKQPSVTD